MRYQDPEGDYGRQKRQREVIQKVVEKVLSLNSVSHYQSILKALSTNMQTNIDLSAKSIPSLLGYQDSFKTIETQQLRGEDAELQGTSYQIVTTNHLLEIQNLLRTSLDKPKVTELETNAVLYEDIFGNRNNTGLGKQVRLIYNKSRRCRIIYFIVKIVGKFPAIFQKIRIDR